MAYPATPCGLDTNLFLPPVSAAIPPLFIVLATSAVLIISVAKDPSVLVLAFVTSGFW